MSQSLTSLSPSKLKSLKAGETISILYKENDSTDSANIRMLCEAFPKNVATTFSSKWKDEFPPINKMKVGDIQKIGAKKSVVVTGGDFETYKDIVNWMLASCNGKGLAQLPTRELRPFTYLVYLRGCSNRIGCDYLAKEADKRMGRIAATQIHSEDVRSLWFLTPADCDMRKFLAEHVAIRFWEKKLLAKSAYWTLREQIPEFDTAINEFIAVKKAERTGEKKKLWEERQRERAARRVAGARGYGRGEWATKTNWRKRNNENQAPGQAEPKTVTLKMEVVRKGTSKQPPYAKLDLAAIGVTKEQFCGRR